MQHGARPACVAHEITRDRDRVAGQWIAAAHGRAYRWQQRRLAQRQALRAQRAHDPDQLGVPVGYGARADGGLVARVGATPPAQQPAEVARHLRVAVRLSSACSIIIISIRCNLNQTRICSISISLNYSIVPFRFKQLLWLFFSMRQTLNTSYPDVPTGTLSCSSACRTGCTRRATQTHTPSTACAAATDSASSALTGTWAC